MAKKDNNTSNIPNMAALGQQTTEFQENAIGPIHKTFQTNALKRPLPNSRISRISGLTAASASAAKTVRERRAYKKGLKLRANTLSALTDAVANLEARILLLEAQN